MTRLCEYCEKPFEPYIHHAASAYPGKPTRFCSRDCSGGWIGDVSAKKAREKRDDICQSGLIQLTRGHYVQVDKEDYQWASLLNWYLDSYGYAVRKPKSGNVKLHRLIMEHKLGRKLLRTERVDHKNLNPLDCQRDNLRLATVGQNSMNRVKSRNNTSGYKGVHWDKARNKWLASIKADGSQLHIGRFEDRQEAAWMYDQYALQLFGEFARTNFEYC